MAGNVNRFSTSELQQAFAAPLTRKVKQYLEHFLEGAVWFTTVAVNHGMYVHEFVLLQYQ